ncbi:hypothetical protein JR316_0005516 [Psilocybe cubensis]|uniref:Uncharacterized protein n=1 Tax=Psilocybe cubensis TaxID=181762 RepID=A0ACB8GZD0_PSICU|nr:hypothetical protein JR316_0005516 [Psilocybe cubensis]KAH9480998.1 hypothetical protein JR316_0005516 [Psilocybe cubensis]
MQVALRKRAAAQEQVESMRSHHIQLSIHTGARRKLEATLTGTRWRLSENGFSFKYMLRAFHSISLHPHPHRFAQSPLQLQSIK